MVIILLAALSACSLQKKAELQSETFALSPFSKIYFEGPGNLTLTQGENPSLSVIAPKNVFDHIEYQVSNDTLFIGLNETLLSSSFNPEISIQYQIVATQMEEISFLGAGTLTISDLNSNHFLLKRNSVGRTNLNNVNINFLDMQLTGGGQVVASGNTNEQNLSLNGAINYDGTSLSVSSFEGDLSGNSNAIIKVQSSLTVRTKQNCTVQYYGDPEFIKIDGNPNTVTPILIEQ